MNKKIVIIGVISLVIDQILKSMIQIYNVHINIINNFFSINYYQNNGAAWSILEGRQYLLITVSIIMLVLVYNMSFSYNESKISNLGFGLLFGGIIGNLIDRIFYGYVRDFIDFNIFGYDYPVFNIADMAIVIGVILILFKTFKGVEKNGNRSSRKSG
jgi:signal peptidase II